MFCCVEQASEEESLTPLAKHLGCTVSWKDDASDTLQGCRRKWLRTSEHVALSV